MKHKIFTLMKILGWFLPVIISSEQLVAQNPSDTLVKQSVSLGDRIAGVEERIATAENDLAKLTKIRLSGYVQAQWQHFEAAYVYPDNYFSIRRARFKVQYEPATGIAFVLQPEFEPGAILLKEAYARVNEPWLKTFSLWAGKFNRLNYEVEYSSADLELLERSRVIRILNPGETAFGVKLEAAPPKIPLKFQLAVYNGSDNLAVLDAQGININPENRDFDNAKDLMGRLTYGFKFGKWGGLNIGASGYYGFLRATVDTLLHSDYTLDKTLAPGKYMDKQWFGVEAQFYVDLLGGLTVKGEYLMGVLAYPGYRSASTVNSPAGISFSPAADTMNITTGSTTTTNYRPNITRNFYGYYIYLIKNIGKRHQVALRWDYYDPNTKISGNEIGNTAVYGKNKTATATETTVTGNDPVIIHKKSTSTVMNSAYKSGVADIAYGTLGIAYHYFLSSNIKLSLLYEIPMNEKVGVNPATGEGYVNPGYTVNGVPGTIDYSKRFSQNVLTVRIQARF